MGDAKPLSRDRDSGRNGSAYQSQGASSENPINLVPSRQTYCGGEVVSGLYLVSVFRNHDGSILHLTKMSKCSLRRLQLFVCDTI